VTEHNDHDEFRTEHASKPHSASVGRNLSPCHLNMDGPAVVAGADVSGGLDVVMRSDLSEGHWRGQCR
jgi:hypothetical protein